MILINPVHKVSSGVVRGDYAINLKLANMLYTGLVAKGESCKLPLTESGDYLSSTNYSKMFNSESFSIIFNLSCLTDVGSLAHGYSVDCSANTSLVACISAELAKWGGPSIYPAGFKKSIISTEASLVELTLGIGFTTNAEDYARLSNDIKLQELSDMIIAAVYAPPVRNMQPDTNIGVADPYFYDSTAWHEDASSVALGDASAIVNSTIDSIPVKLLNVKTIPDSMDNPETVEVETTFTREKPLRWYTEISDDLWAQNVLIIYSYRFNSEGGLTVQLNNSSKLSHTYVDKEWHTVNFPATLTIANSVLNIYVDGGTDVDVTAVWVSKASVLGSLDDPLTAYTKYPPAYSPITSLDYESIAAYNGTVSTASSLLGKAAEVAVIASSAAALTSALSKIDQVPLNTTALVNASANLITAINGLGSNSGSVDISKIKVDYSVLVSALSSISRGDKKAAVLTSVNKMKGLEAAKNTAVQTKAEKETEASVLKETMLERETKASEELGKA